MNSNSPCPKVIDPQYTADNIPAHAIEDQDFPNRVAIFIQDGGRVGDEAAVGGRVMSGIICRARLMVQVEELLD